MCAAASAALYAALFGEIFCQAAYVTTIATTKEWSTALTVEERDAVGDHGVARDLGCVTMVLLWATFWAQSPSDDGTLTAQRLLQASSERVKLGLYGGPLGLLAAPLTVARALALPLLLLSCIAAAQVRRAMVPWRSVLRVQESITMAEHRREGEMAVALYTVAVTAIVMVLGAAVAASLGVATDTGLLWLSATVSVVVAAVILGLECHGCARMTDGKEDGAHRGAGPAYHRTLSRMRGLSQTDRDATDVTEGERGPCKWGRDDIEISLEEVENGRVVHSDDVSDDDPSMGQWNTLGHGFLTLKGPWNGAAYHDDDAHAASDDESTNSMSCLDSPYPLVAHVPRGVRLYWGSYDAMRRVCACVIAVVLAGQMVVSLIVSYIGTFAAINERPAEAVFGLLLVFTLVLLPMSYVAIVAEPLLVPCKPLPPNAQSTLLHEDNSIHSIHRSSSSSSSSSSSGSSRRRSRSSTHFTDDESHLPLWHNRDEDWRHVWRREHESRDEDDHDHYNIDSGHDHHEEMGADEDEDDDDDDNDDDDEDEDELSPLTPLLYTYGKIRQDGSVSTAHSPLPRRDGLSSARNRPGRRGMPHPRQSQRETWTRTQMQMQRRELAPFPSLLPLQLCEGEEGGKGAPVHGWSTHTPWLMRTSPAPPSSPDSAESSFALSFEESTSSPLSPLDSRQASPRETEA